MDILNSRFDYKKLIKAYVQFSLSALSLCYSLVLENVFSVFTK